MKQIVNWTFGSFFRTLGKVLLFVCIGFIIANLVDLGDITSNFRITDLFGLQKVSALTLTDDVSWVASGYFEATSTTDTLTDYSRSYWFTVNNSPTANYHTLNFTSNLNPYLADYIVFGFFAGQSTQTETNHNYTTDAPFCDLWKQNSSGAWYCDHSFNVQSSNNDYVITDYELDKLNIYVFIVLADNDWYNCTIENNELVCPTHNKQVKSLTISVKYNTQKTSSVQIAVNRGYSIYKSNNLQSAIEQQTQQQAQEHNETMQTITDTNTTTDSTSANNFILNQQDDTPNGLTAAVTAPLTIMQNLILASNTPLCFTLNGKQSCIPDGYTLFWGRSQSAGQHWFDSGQFNPRAAFITLFNLVVGGFLCYKMLLSMLRIYNDMLDPTNSKIEVLKL